MANICCVDLVFEADDKTLYELSQFLHRMVNKSYGEIAREAHCKGEHIYGHLVAVGDVEDGYVCASANTAWLPRIDFWYGVLDALGMNDTEVGYCAVEPGCGVFLGNSLGTSSFGEYYVELYDNLSESGIDQRICDIFMGAGDGYFSAQEIKDVLSRAFGKGKRLSVLLKELEALDIGDYFSVHKFREE